MWQPCPGSVTVGLKQVHASPLIWQLMCLHNTSRVAVQIMTRKLTNLESVYHWRMQRTTWTRALISTEFLYHFHAVSMKIFAQYCNELFPAVADRGGMRDEFPPSPPPGPISFIFIQFSAKTMPNNRLVFPVWIRHLSPSLGYSRIQHCTWIAKRNKGRIRSRYLSVAAFRCLQILYK